VGPSLRGEVVKCYKRLNAGGAGLVIYNPEASVDSMKTALYQLYLSFVLQKFMHLFGFL
jgi:hypothetical protein